MNFLLAEAKIAGLRAPRMRKEIDHFFRLWFRHMYDIGEASPKAALPVYLPVVGAHSSQGKWVSPSPSPFCVTTDAGYMKLKPLKTLSECAPRASREVDDDRGGMGEGTLRIEESVAELLRLYGLRGGQWDTLGDEGVMMALDYLCAKGAVVEREEVGKEQVARFLETLADVQAGQLGEIDSENGMNVMSVLAKSSVVGNGTCARLIFG